MSDPLPCGDQSSGGRLQGRIVAAGSAAAAITVIFGTGKFRGTLEGVAASGGGGLLEARSSLWLGRVDAGGGIVGGAELGRHRSAISIAGRGCPEEVSLTVVIFAGLDSVAFRAIVGVTAGKMHSINAPTLTHYESDALFGGLVWH